MPSRVATFSTTPIAWPPAAPISSTTLSTNSGFRSFTPDRRAKSGELQRRGAPNAVSRAGDQRHPACKELRHRFTLLWFKPPTPPRVARRRSLPQNIRSPRKNVGTPKAPRPLASSSSRSCRARVSALREVAPKGLRPRGRAASAGPRAPCRRSPRRRRRSAAAAGGNTAPARPAVRRQAGQRRPFGSTRNATGSRNGMP